MKEYRVIGLMSGTSGDGIDAASLLIADDGRITREGFITIAYAEEMHEAIRAAFHKPREAVRQTETALTLAHAHAVKMLMDKLGLKPADVDLIGFHGQTISHAPERGHTCQIGDGPLLAELTGIRVVNDFRTADVKAGGQGAPLVPVYHQAIAAGLEKPVVFLNIGGVANVTYVGESGALMAFDTGPGNALLDDWMRENTGKRYDTNGAAASAGRADEAILKKLLDHPFFSKLPPKSLDRDTFASDLWKGMSLEDGAATLAAFTVRTIARAQHFFPAKPKQWIVAGGGRHNLFFMQELQKNVGALLRPIEALKLDGDATEAEAFAWLAFLSLRGQPLSFPDTTGVSAPMTGGTLHTPAAAARAPKPGDPALRSG